MNNAAFASMRIRMFERQLLVPEQFARLLHVDYIGQALDILRETRYGDLIRDEGNRTDVEQILRKELERRAEELLDVAEDPDLARFLFLRYDYHNIKILIKAPSDPERFEPLLFPFGTLEIKKSKKILEHPTRSAESDWHGTALVEGARVWRQTEDAQALDFVVDRCFAQDMSATADAVNSDFFRAYARERIDLMNMLTFFRAKRQNRTRDFIRHTFLPGGTIRVEEVINPAISSSGEREIGTDEFFGVDPTAIRQLLAHNPVSNMLKAGVEEFFHTGDITALEKAKDEYVYRVGLQASKFTLGPEVLLSYLIRVETEIQNLRIILSGKRVGLPVEEIRARLRTRGNVPDSERGSHA